MNGLERYRAVLSGEPCDFLPRLPILMRYAAEHIGSCYGEFASDYRVLVQANLRCAADFGFDQLSAISDPYRETAGFGAQIEFPRDEVPRCQRPPLASSKDPGSLASPDPRSSERMRDRVRAVAALRSGGGDMFSVMGWIEGPAAEAADLRGVTAFLMDLMDDPDFSARLMDLCTEVGIEFARAQIDSGADTVGVGDAICSQLSPDLYADLVLPRQRRMVEAIHAAGAWCRLHICGDIAHLLPHIADLGMDICDCDWQVDMAHARRVLGDKVVLCGNLDPVAAVKDSCPGDIRSAVRNIYRSVGDPYMVGAGCEIPSGTPVRNLRALCTPVHTGR